MDWYLYFWSQESYDCRRIEAGERELTRDESSNAPQKNRQQME